jgi:hypothetical protein
MKIDCLMGTYGRFGLACEALACFLQQTALSNATLLIYNQHSDPLYFDHPRVRVVNEPGRDVALRHIRQRMHELADPSADFLHWWDDDDLYLPWHLEDCLGHIGDNVAWKPASCWMLNNGQYSRHANTFEGSWIFRAEYLKAAPIDTHPNYSDHPVIRQTAQANLLATAEFGDRTSYIYRWGISAQHHSALGGSGDESEQIDNIAKHRTRNSDVDPTGRMVVPDMADHWQHFLDGTFGKIALRDWGLNAKRLRAHLRS